MWLLLLLGWVIDICGNHNVCAPWLTASVGDQNAMREGDVVLSLLLIWVVPKAPRRLDLLARYRELATAKPHCDLVRAVCTARFAHPIRIGSSTSPIDVIGVETPLVRHGGDQHAVAIDVDVT